MWSARAHEVKKMCSDVKYILKNGGKCKRWSPMIPKWIPILGVALVRESQMFKALVEKENKHQIGPLRYHWKGLEL
jgi:hypothetical protein